MRFSVVARKQRNPSDRKKAAICSPLFTLSLSGSSAFTSADAIQKARTHPVMPIHCFRMLQLTQVGRNEEIAQA
ncbi:MAG TPA: hypothetical protein VED46_02470 [Alphaproteobacteria bacterium]|nr:hypothetical protein [Alphaproteobacteria bacterium]